MISSVEGGRASRPRRKAVARELDGRWPKILYSANVASFFYKFLLPYADHFRGQGWRVDAMSKGFDEFGDYDFSQSFDHVWEVDWARKPHELRNAAKIVRQIQAITDIVQYDLIHVHTPVAAMVTRYALRHRDIGRTKIVYTTHGFHFFAGAPRVGGAVYKSLETVASRWTDYLVVMNEEDRASARQLKRIPDENVTSMPGIGVDLEKYKAQGTDRSDVRRKFNISEDELMLACVAEFIPRKRHEDLIRALARVGDPRIKLVFAGDGELQDSMKVLAASLGLSGQTHFLGFWKDVPSLLAGADCLVLPSAQEGLPRSVMEAMCSGVPVIAADIRGTRDLLAQGVGTLYPVGDVAALSAAIKGFRDNPERYREGVLEGMHQIKKYDVKNVIEMHENLYAKALGVTREALIERASVQRGYLG